MFGSSSLAYPQNNTFHLQNALNGSDTNFFCQTQPVSINGSSNRLECISSQIIPVEGCSTYISGFNTCSSCSQGNLTIEWHEESFPRFFCEPVQLSCPNNQFIDEQNVCVDCSDSIKGKSGCKECSYKNRTFDSKKFTCLICKDKFYKDISDPDDEKCLSCMGNCDNCDLGTSTCQQCSSLHEYDLGLNHNYHNFPYKMHIVDKPVRSTKKPCLSDRRQIRMLAVWIRVPSLPQFNRVLLELYTRLLSTKIKQGL